MIDHNKKIESWLKIMKIKKYTINDDFIVDVDGNVDISYKKLNIIPVKFGIINGNFWCDRNNLNSFKNSPNIIHGNFWCYKNPFDNYDDLPNIINGHFTHDGNESLNIKKNQSLNEIKAILLYQKLQQNIVNDKKLLIRKI